MNNKLTITQQKVLDRAKIDIDTARKYISYEEYFLVEEAKNYNSNYNTPEKYKAMDNERWNLLKGYWERQIIGITLTHCDSRTIKKLEKLNLIKIIYNSSYQGGAGIDTIKVLNY